MANLQGQARPAPGRFSLSLWTKGTANGAPQKVTHDTTFGVSLPGFLHFAIGSVRDFSRLIRKSRCRRTSIAKDTTKTSQPENA